MKKFLCLPWVLLGLRILVGAVFVYAGVIKLQDPQGFADSIATFRMLPNGLITIFALALPPFEILVGLMLIFGWRPRSAAFGVGLLAVVFAIALGQALLRGLEVDCGCFGSGEPSVAKTWASLGRDLLLLIAAGWLWIGFGLVEGRRTER